MSGFRYHEEACKLEESMLEMLSFDSNGEKIAMEPAEHRDHPSTGAIARIAAKRTPLEEVQAVLAAKRMDPASAAVLHDVITPEKKASLDAFLDEARAL